MAKKAKVIAIDPNRATLQELQGAVRTLAKRANQRLVRLERTKQEGKSDTYGAAYAASMEYLAASGRTRFKERTGKMTANELRREYNQVQSFLSRKESTQTGRKEMARNRYNTYKAAGFKGSYKDFNEYARRLWSAANVAKYGSETIYQVFTSARGSWDKQKIMLDTMVKAIEKEERTRGAALLDTLRQKEKEGLL